MSEKSVSSPQLKDHVPSLKKEIEELMEQISEFETIVETLRTENASLTKRLQISSSSVSENHSRVIENSTFKTQTITKTIKVPSEKIPPTQIGTIFTSLKKARVINNLFNHLEIRRSQRTFYSILEAGIKSRQAWAYASKRMKGRLLQVLHEKYADAGGVRKAFLRWWVIVHSTFQRDCITKVALNARLTHQSALWRFRKMVIKNVRVKLPEAVRKMRYVTGLFKLDSMTRGDHLTKLIEAFNQMRPDLISVKYSKLISLVTNKAIYDEKIKITKMNYILKTHRTRKQLIKDLVERYLRKQSHAYDRLVDNAKSFGGGEAAENRKRKSLSKLINNLNDLTADAWKRLLDNIAQEKRRAKLVDLMKHHLCSTLIQKQFQKVREGLKNLKENAMISIIRDKETIIETEVVKLVKQKHTKVLIHRLVTAQQGKTGDALSKARRYKDFSSRGENQKKDAIRKLLLKLLDGSRGKLGNALNRLGVACNDQLITEITEKAKFDMKSAVDRKRMNSLLDKLRNGLLGKEGQAFSELAKNSGLTSARQALQAIKDEFAQKDQASKLRLLNRTADAKKRDGLADAFNRLRQNARQLSAAEQAKLRKLNNLARTLAGGLLGKEGDAFTKLLLNALGATKDGKISSLEEAMKREKTANGLRNLMGKLKKGCDGKEKQTLKDLRELNSQQRSIENMEDYKKRLNKKLTNKMIIDLMQAQKSKMLHAFVRLKENHKNIAVEENEKNFEKTLFELKTKDKKRGFLNKLITRMNAKRDPALKKLIDNALEQRFANEKEEQIRLWEKEKQDNLVKMLLNRLGLKEREAYRRLKEHESEGNMDPEMIKKNKLITDLINKLLGKQNGAARRLVNNHRYASLQDIMEREKKTNLFKGLVAAQETKEKESLTKLGAYSRFVGNSEKSHAEKQRIYSDRLTSFMMIQTKSSKIEAYKKMVLFTQRQKKGDNLKKKLLQSLNKSSQGKVGVAMYNLRQNNLQVWGDEKINDTIVEITIDKVLNLKRKLLRKLYKAYSIKANQAFKKLEFLNTEFKERELDGKKRLETLMGRARLNVKNSTVDAYRRLVAYAYKNKQYERKFKNLLSNILSQMQANNKFMELQALNRLIQNKNDLNALTSNKFRRTKALIQRLIAAQEGKEREAFTSQRIFTTETALEDLMKKKALSGCGIVSKLEQAMDAKLAEAFNRLRNHSNALCKKQLLESGLLRNLANLISKNQELKLEDAWKLLGKNKDDLAREEAKTRKALNTLIGKLRDAYRAKQAQANSELLNYGKRFGPNIDPLEEAAKLLGAYLRGGSKGKLGDALNLLRANHDETLKKEVEEKRLVDVLRKKVSLGYSDNRAQAYRLMKDFATKQRLAESATGLNKKKLVERLIKAFTNKRNDAEGLLKDHFLRSKGADALDKMRKSLLFGKLKRGLNGQLGDAFDLLQSFSKGLSEKEKNQEKKKTFLVKRLISAQNSKKDEGFDNLGRNLRSSKNSELKKQLLKNNLVGKLVKSQQGKVNSGMSSMQKFSVSEILKMSKREGIKKKLLQKLVNSSQSKMRQAVHSMASQKLLIEVQETTRNTKVRNATKLFMDKMRNRVKKDTQVSMQKLITHTLNQRVRTERTKKLLSEIRMVEKTKVIKSVYKMKINSMLEAIKAAERKEKLGRLLEKMYRRMIKGGYHKLLKNAFMKSRLQQIFSRAEMMNSRLNSKLIKSYMDRLKELLKLNGERANRIYNMLASMIRVRTSTAFSEIKIRYELHKRDRMNRGLVRFSNYIERAVYKRKSETFAIIKKLYHVENPWFKHAISKFTIFASTNEQVAFWKIRLLKNLGETNVSPERAIKLRQFAERMNKKRANAVSAAFSRILVSVSNPDSMNVSFLASQRVAGLQALGTPRGHQSSRYSNI
jgi:hypothetical protein